MNTQTLGDNNRNRKFDDGLADTLNRKTEEESKVEKKKIFSKKPVDVPAVEPVVEPVIAAPNSTDPVIVVRSGKLCISKMPGECADIITTSNTQKNWVDYWNKKTVDNQPAYAMASLTDYYAASKNENWFWRKKFQSYLKNGNLIVTNDKVVYNSNNPLGGTIMSHFNDKLVKSLERKVNIPYLPQAVPLISRNPVGAMMIDYDNWNYIQSLFNTMQNMRDIRSNLAKLSGCKEDKVAIRTPDEATRRRTDIVCVPFMYRAGDTFIVDISIESKHTGLSYGVGYERPPNRRSKWI